MPGLGDIGQGLGDIAGYFFGADDRDAARKKLQEMQAGYEKLEPNIVAQQTGPSAYASADPGTRAAQMDALSEFRNKYQQGGLDAVDRGKLAEIEANTNQTATAAGGAAVDSAARRGMLNSATALAAQQNAGQAAATRGAMQGTQAAADAERARTAAIGGAASVATGARAQDYERAGAQDAINRFNASQRQGAEQSTFNNAFARQGGIAGAQGAQYGQSMDDARRIQGLAGGVGRMAGGVANYFVPGGAAAGGAG